MDATEAVFVLVVLWLLNSSVYGCTVNLGMTASNLGVRLMDTSTVYAFVPGMFQLKCQEGS